MKSIRSSRETLNSTLKLSRKFLKFLGSSSHVPIHETSFFIATPLLHERFKRRWDTRKEEEKITRRIILNGQRISQEKKKTSRSKVPNAEIEAMLPFNLLATKDRLAMSGDLLGRQITSEIWNERGAGPPRRAVNYRPKMSCCFRSRPFFFLSGERYRQITLGYACWR